MIRIEIEKKLRSVNGEMLLKARMEIEENALTVLYGKSGAGKTSLLRALAGLLEPDAGRIEVDEEIWYDSRTKTDLAPQKRRIGFVFQDYSLFPNMTVRQNLEYATNGSNKEIVEELLEATELLSLQSRRPDTLSGGQKQRVALARALCRRPRILLLDEPLSALHPEMRLQLQELIVALHRKFHTTTLLVTHDLAELFRMSGSVYVMEEGKIVASGSPESVFLDKRFSGKFRFTGELLAIEKSDVVYVLTLAAGNHIVKVVATEEERAELKVGDRLMVLSKAFNPIIFKLK